jgi:hypothetical protein
MYRQGKKLNDCPVLFALESSDTVCSHWGTNATGRWPCTLWRGGIWSPNILHVLKTQEISFLRSYILLHLWFGKKDSEKKGKKDEKSETRLKLR